MKLQLTPKQVLEWIILGIKNERYQAAINMAQDCIDQMPDGLAIKCDHEWTDARNEVVKSGEICLKCNSMRAT